MLWVDSIGAKYIHGMLQEWAKRYGSFFKPCSYLAERAAKGIPLVSMSGIPLVNTVGALLVDYAVADLFAAS